MAGSSEDISGRKLVFKSFLKEMGSMVDLVLQERKNNLKIHCKYSAIKIMELFMPDL